MNTRGIAESGSNYVKFGNGTLIQWGNSDFLVGKTERVITLHKPLDGSAYTVLLTGGSGGSAEYKYNSFTLLSRYSTNFHCRCECTEKIYTQWIAIGTEAAI